MDNLTVLKSMGGLFGKILSNTGDKFEACITKSGRGVVKILKGGAKYSATCYKNGTIVETITRKRR